MSDRERFRRLEELFHRASSATETERARLLAEAREDSTELAAELERLLATGTGRADVREPQIDEPRRVGPYRLLRRLGEGGMGEVWEAEQSEPLERRVALKLIRPGLGSREVVDRFEAERQVLARMNHPHIARVYDAGTTDDGRPWFAMELVDGEPIDVFCDRQRLTVRERLELIERICDAVQHAHRRGVIHRDLKPSNLLVTRDEDGTPLPKVIDFGIAKAVGDAEAVRSLFTRAGQLVGTPEYMSPEQADLVADLDTRTDVYSLGVVLYQLLVGELPLAGEELRAAAFDEIRRRLRETETPRPSSRVSTDSEAARVAASNRGTDPASLEREIRDELDWIVLKALARRREDRYDSPSDLATDLRRHRLGEPVSAGPPSRAYRLRKLVARHRVAAASIAAVVLALVTGSGLALLGLLRARSAEADAREAQRAAEREASTARAASDFLIELFEVSDPSRATADELSARQILDRGVERVRDSLDDEPRVRAEMMRTLGHVYGKLGLYPEGRALLEEALEVLEDEAGAESPDVAAALERLGYFEIVHLDDPGAAVPLLERAVEIRKLEADPEARIEALRVLGEARMRAFEYERAREHLNEALELSRLADPRSHRTATILNTLGVLEQNAGEWEASAARIAEALSICEEVLGLDAPDSVLLASNLAWSYTNLGRPLEALPLIERDLEYHRRTLGPRHIYIATTDKNLAETLASMGRWEEASAALEEADSIYREQLGDDHYHVAEIAYMEGQLANWLGRFDQAAANLEEGIAKVRGAGHERETIFLVRSFEQLAAARRLGGDLPGAEAACDEAIDLLDALPSDLDPRVQGLDCRLQLALIALAGSDADEARRRYREAIAGIESRRVLDHPKRPTIRADYLARAGDPDRAIELLREAFDLGLIHASILTDPDLATLRQRPEFEALRRDLQARFPPVGNARAGP